MKKKCIYCREDKNDEKFTLEHIFPQFLGGAYASDIFKTRDVCERCNNNLGLFVDAGFEKNWFVSNHLRFSAFAFLDPNNLTSVPLICMGESDLGPPGMDSTDVCEAWLGPFGEAVFWIRALDEKLYWYSGGNPITTKKVESRAYFLFSERTHNLPKLTWLSFRDAFEGRKVKKIMCTDVIGADPSEIGFSPPDELDQVRIQHFLNKTQENHARQHRLPIYTQFDFRFLAKIAIGVAHALFGEKALHTTYASELYKALWYRNGEEVPSVNGTTPLMHETNSVFAKMMGEENAVTITITPQSGGIALNLNLGGTLNWIIKCASHENIDADVLTSLGHGKVIVLYKYLQRSVELPLLDYMAHKRGNMPNASLTEIAKKANLYIDWLKQKQIDFPIISSAAEAVDRGCRSACCDTGTA
jgi:hypothetical protein